MVFNLVPRVDILENLGTTVKRYLTVFTKYISDGTTTIDVSTLNNSSTNTVVITNSDSPYTITNSNNILCDTTSGNITVNLPSGTENKAIIITNTGSSGNTVSVVPASKEQLFKDGAGVPFTLYDKETINIIYDTTEGWWG